MFFCNSGAEAVDGAIKLARKVTGKAGVIAFRRAFHGRTLAATSLTTAKGKYREGYEPLLGGVTVVDYCVARRAPERGRRGRAALAELDEVLSLQLPDGNVGAMIVEPVLGEGGYVVPPVAWLEGLRGRCDEHGILLVFDEVQCGMGRTGHAVRGRDVRRHPRRGPVRQGRRVGPAARRHRRPAALMERWPNGAHGSTFGGNPVACAAALATIEVLEREGLFDRAAAARHARHRAPAAVDRRRSTWSRRARHRPDDRRRAARQGRRRRRAGSAASTTACIVLTCGPGENVLRLVPPLTITDDELDHGLAILERGSRDP